MRSDAMDERATVLLKTLRERMAAETGLFVELGQRMERLREAFQAKSWGTSIAIAQGVEGLSRSLEDADASRDESFVALRDALSLPRETAFSAVLPSLPDPARTEIEEAWRSLRMSVVRLKTATGTLRYSAEALSDTLNRMLNEVFPYRRGKIYSRRGTAKSVDGAMLVDQKR